MAALAVLCYSELSRRSRRLIDHHVTALGHTLLSCNSEAFLNGRSLYRTYRIRYQDQTGRIHEALAQTGPHRHVMIRHERVVQSGSGPPPLPIYEQIRLLENENEALRQEIKRLSVGSDSRTSPS